MGSLYFIVNNNSRYPPLPTIFNLSTSQVDF
jgi:hypothetical protein